MKILFLLLMLPVLFLPAFGQDKQMASTDKGTLDVELSVVPASPRPGDSVDLRFDFINPTTERTQEHIDWVISIKKDGEPVARPGSHSTSGIVEIPLTVEEGRYDLDVEVSGILFQPIPKEMVSFAIGVGQDVPAQVPDGGGCLIATATYGSELAPQVQFLRELRDGTVLSTSSGASFMAGFNSLYYGFSPAIADLERQNPAFKEAVKIAITPMLLSLNIMSLADEGSEISVLSLGISTIFVNLGMYVGLPVLVVTRLYRLRHGRNKVRIK